MKIADANILVDRQPINGKDEKAAKQWEAYFVHQLLKEMRKTIPKGGLLGESSASDTFYDMLDQQIAKNISENGSFGFSKFMMENMFRSKSKEVSQTGQIEAYQKNSV
jgi:Rod binding domain-containing protein